MPEPIKPYQEFVDKNYNPNSKLDWRPESWLGERAESVTGPKYTEEDVRIFRSHVPEYKKIEREARKNGTWLQMPDGTTWTGDPREWVMMQSEAFKKNYQDNPWYTGQAEWATKVTLPDGTVVDTDKVKRARYHNGEMWFSNDAGYAQYFADIIDSSKLSERYHAGSYWDDTTDSRVAPESKIKGKVFLAGIPKTGNYRHLDQNHTPDYWQDMPYDLTENDIVRTSSENIQNTNDYRRGNIKVSGENLKTDDLVNHSRQLGDDGLFIYNVNDGPALRKDNEKIDYKPIYTNEYPWGEDGNNARPAHTPINEFISQPGFTEKIKFIRGNNGNFDPNTDDKYSAIFKIDSPLFAKKGGRIHIKKKNRGKFTEYCGGKVTEECIARGKRSKNPLTRKRANFASVVRKWKHENGGILKYQNPAITLDLPEGSAYGGELEPAVVKPRPYWGELKTYYPVISAYPFTGHSELDLYNHSWEYIDHISKYGDDYDYNLVTNNCSDATRCAVEQIFNEKINPSLFTTPGDVRDFLLKKGVDAIDTEKGVESQSFEIPFATAMDLKNQNIDFYIQDYLHKAAKTKKQMKKENPNWDSTQFDLDTAEVIQRYKDQKYKFQPFKDKNGGILKAQEGATTSSERTPTLEEYIRMKLQEARQMALANSYSAIEPRLAKKYYNEYDLANLQLMWEHSDGMSDWSNESAEEKEKELNHPLAPKNLFIFHPKYRNDYAGMSLNDAGEKLLNDLISDRYNTVSYKEEAKALKDRLDSINKYGYDWTGYNCITNATGWYGDPYVCASNVDFKKDPSKYGFVEINADDALPGDIFQYDENGGPYHATMYSKKGDNDTYYTNYSNGMYNESIKHDSTYWGKGQRAFRFVGLPKDIETWTREHNELYGKKFGGILDKFKKGGILKAQNGINMYPVYGSQQKAKFAYDAGSRNPEAIGATIPTRIGLDGSVESGNIKNTTFTTITNNNGSSNTNFESKSTISYNDGLYNTSHIGNSNNNGVINNFEHHSFGMPNGDRYYTYNNNGVRSDRYEVDYAKRLGLDKLPKT